MRRHSVLTVGLVFTALMLTLSCATGTVPPSGGGGDRVSAPRSTLDALGTPRGPGTALPAPVQGPAARAEPTVTAITERVPGAHVGLAVYDRSTGRPVAEHAADAPFYTASVVKLAIATHVLRSNGWRPPADAHAHEQLVRMLSRSNDSIASSLWAGHGGPELLRETTALMGLPDTTAPAEAGEWELTRTTPRDMVRLYTFLTTSMPRPAAEVVLSALAHTSRIADDGFDQGFGIPEALPRTTTGVKQGWMRVDGELVLHTTGVVGPGHRYLVVLLTRHPSGTDFDRAAEALTAGIAALRPELATG